MEDVRRRVDWVLVLVYAAIITWLSSRPGGKLPRWSIMKHDKILHAIEYAGLGALLCRALAAGRAALGRHAALGAVLLGVTFGVVDEFHQSFVAGRNGNDLGDIAADLCGAVLGAFAFLLFSGWLARRSAAVREAG